MTRLLAKKKAGFTLLELMIVVAILGILAAVAIPAFMTYIRRSKTGEATTNVEKIFTAAATYYAKQVVDAPGVVANVLTQCSVDAIPINPAAPTANKQPISAVIWDPTNNAHPTTAIGFTIADPVFYSYRSDSRGGGTVADCGLGAVDMYTFYAIGDLDGDGTQSSFSQAVGAIAAAGGFELSKAGAMYVQDELE